MRRAFLAVAGLLGCSESGGIGFAAVDLESGEVAWTTTVDGSEMRGLKAAGDEVLYSVNDCEGAVSDGALAADSGAGIAPTHSWVDVIGQSRTGRVAFVAVGGDVQALDVDGELLWSLHVADVEQLSDPSAGQIGDLAIVWGGGRTGLYGLDLDSGSREWHQDSPRVRIAPEQPDDVVLVYQAPPTDGDRGFSLTGRDRTTGEELWSWVDRYHDLVGVAGAGQSIAVLAQERTYTYGPELKVYDAATGAVRWSELEVQQVALTDGLAVTVDSQGRQITAFDAFTGDEEWTSMSDVYRNIYPAVDGSVLVLNKNRDGAPTLEKITAAGTVEWTRSLGGTSVHTPVLLVREPYAFVAGLGGEYCEQGD